MEEKKKIALFIDCDNARAVAIYGIVEELSNYGETCIRRAYGNWKGNNPWEEMLHPFAIQPVQQFAYTKGKNAKTAIENMLKSVNDPKGTEKKDLFRGATDKGMDDVLSTPELRQLQQACD